MSLSRRSLLARSLGGAFSLPLLSLPARAATHQVAIRGMAFEPATLTIAIGDSVTFTNEDSAPHTATATNGAFDTGRLGRGDAAEDAALADQRIAVGRLLQFDAGDDRLLGETPQGGEGRLPAERLDGRADRLGVVAGDDLEGDALLREGGEDGGRIGTQLVAKGDQSERAQREALQRPVKCRARRIRRPRAVTLLSPALAQRGPPSSASRRMLRSL